MWGRYNASEQGGSRRWVAKERSAPELAIQRKLKTYEGRVAIANVGLAGCAITGNKWETQHRPFLLEQLTAMLDEDNIWGLMLCEIGNWDDPLEPEARKRVSELLW